MAGLKQLLEGFDVLDSRLDHINGMSYHSQRISILKKHRQGVKPCQVHDMSKKILRHSILPKMHRSVQLSGQLQLGLPLRNK